MNIFWRNKMNAHQPQGGCKAAKPRVCHLPHHGETLRGAAGGRFIDDY